MERLVAKIGENSYICTSCVDMMTEYEDKSNYKITENVCCNDCKKNIPIFYVTKELPLCINCWSSLCNMIEEGTNAFNHINHKCSICNLEH